MPVLENWCGYAAVGAGARAGKHRLPLLVGPGGRPPPKDLVSRVKRAVSRFDVKTIAEAYPKRFEYAQLARHPALVLIPYQVSVMSLFEYYRMCLPLFVPSKELLWSWHKKFKLLKERTWFGVHGRARRQSPLDRHANATRSGVFAFDPNDDFTDDAALAWLQLSDFYQWPHITTFGSLDDLGAVVRNADLDAIADGMRLHNAQTKARVSRQWAAILDRIFPDGERPRALRPRGAEAPKPFDEAMRDAYDVTVHRDCDRPAPPAK